MVLYLFGGRVRTNWTTSPRSAGAYFIFRTQSRTAADTGGLGPGRVGKRRSVYTAALRRRIRRREAPARSTRTRSTEHCGKQTEPPARALCGGAGRASPSQSIRAPRRRPPRDRARWWKREPRAAATGDTACCRGPAFPLRYAGNLSWMETFSHWRHRRRRHSRVLLSPSPQSSAKRRRENSSLLSHSRARLNALFFFSHTPNESDLQDFTRNMTVFLFLMPSMSTRNVGIRGS